jgi:hypothetical protein
MTLTTLTTRAAFAALLLLTTGALAQMTPPTDPAAKLDTDVAPDPRLEPLAFLAGCWRGNVNKREFREHWMPLRGNLLVGTSHTTIGNQTLDFEYLRIEPRADGVYYVATPSKQKEESFKLGEIQKDDGDTILTFTNPKLEFPQRIIYRRGTIGWLYAHVEGTVNGAERKVIYPMRRINCESGELIEK